MLLEFGRIQASRRPNQRLRLRDPNQRSPRGSYVCGEGVEPKPQTALRFTPSTSHRDRVGPRAAYRLDFHWR